MPMPARTSPPLNAAYVPNATPVKGNVPCATWLPSTVVAPSTPTGTLTPVTVEPPSSPNNCRLDDSVTTKVSVWLRVTTNTSTRCERGEHDASVFLVQADRAGGGEGVGVGVVEHLAAVDEDADPRPLGDDLNLVRDADDERGEAPGREEDLRIRALLLPELVAVRLEDEVVVVGQVAEAEHDPADLPRVRR